MTTERAPPRACAKNLRPCTDLAKLGHVGGAGAAPPMPRTRAQVADMASKQSMKRVVSLASLAQHLPTVRQGPGSGALASASPASRP